MTYRSFLSPASLRTAATVRRHRGYSTTDIALGLVVFGILVLVAVASFRGTSQTANVSGVAADLRVIAPKAVKLFPNGNFSALGTTVSAANCGTLINTGVFDNTLFTVTKGTTPTLGHPFGQGSVECGAVDLLGTSDGLRIQLTDSISDSVCPELVNAFETAARRITVDTTVVKAVNGELNQATLATACVATANANNHSIAFDFSR